MRDIMEGGSHIILYVHFQQGKKKNAKHVLNVPSRCEFLKRAQISTPCVSLIATVCNDLAATSFEAIHRSIMDIYSESEKLLNIPFKVDFNNMMSRLPI